jgi:hypothetical protein
MASYAFWSSVGAALNVSQNTKAVSSPPQGSCSPRKAKVREALNLGNSMPRSMLPAPQGTSARLTPGSNSKAGQITTLQRIAAVTPQPRLKIGETPLLQAHLGILREWVHLYGQHHGMPSRDGRMVHGDDGSAGRK